MSVRRTLRIAALALLAAGTWELMGAGYVHAKAFAAQQLLDVAWQRARSGAPAARPWPGADLQPVARLAVPRLGVEQVVLADASGRSLAFGPGHLPGTARPGAAGTANSVIAAHRDTHFAFMRELEVGDAVLVEAAEGRPARYRVTERRVTRADDASVMAEHGDARLTLVTCWPFDAVRSGTPWRYVVVAVRDEGG
jgi:sortase A